MTPEEKGRKYFEEKQKELAFLKNALSLMKWDWDKAEKFLQDKKTLLENWRRHESCILSIRTYAKAILKATTNKQIQKRES